VAVTRRLELLSADVRELLQVAALLGTTFGVADVSAVLGRPGTSLLGSVREATKGRVLSELPGRLAFRHPLAAHAEGRTAEAAAILGATWDVGRTEDPLRFLRHYLVPDLAGFTFAVGDPAAAGVRLRVDGGQLGPGQDRDLAAHAGHPPRDPGGRRRPRFGWDALTEAEKVVAGLVAEGLSNPRSPPACTCPDLPCSFTSPASWGSSARPPGWYWPPWSSGTTPR
jgi:hypothetical protein